MLLVRPRGWHLQERHVEVDGKPVSAGLFDFGVYLHRNTERLLERGYGAVLLPPEAREPPRGAALERRLLLRAGSPRDSARDDQGDRPHRDDPRGLRDGRDPLRASRPLGRAQRGSLGLHLLGHQEVPGSSRVRAPGSRAGDDDRPVHARIHRAPRADVPLARGSRDRGHGRVHPEPARSRGQRERAGPRPRGQGARVGRRLRRHLGCAPRPRPGGEGRVRRRAGRSAKPARTLARGRDRPRRQTS